MFACTRNDVLADAFGRLTWKYTPVYIEEWDVFLHESIAMKRGYIAVASIFKTTMICMY